jgi:hypothetical protein
MPTCPISTEDGTLDAGNGMQLWRELRTQGYMGSASSFRPYHALLRQVPDGLRPAGSSWKKKQDAEQTFSPRHIVGLV